MTGTAAIYVRMSKDRTGAGLGIARQERECRELADKLGLTVAEVYSDNDTSAYRSNTPREGYSRLLADVEAGKVQAVICWHLDRLHRRTSELEKYLTAAQQIPTYTVSGGNLDLTTPAGRATAKTIGAWAQAEVEQKSMRQKAKNRQIAEAGQRHGRGGPVPFGYAEDRLTPHPAYGELVRQAYADVLSGKGLAGIAADWQRAGAPVPQSKKGRWDRASVKRILMRESNAGMVKLAGTILPGVTGEWEPLVSVADYYAARAVLMDPARRTSPGTKPKHLLSGIAVCDTCGHALRRQKVGGRGASYMCSNRASVRGDCPAPVSIPVEVLDEYVTERLLEERKDAPGVLVTVVDGEEAKAQGRSLEEIDARIRSIAMQMAEPDADMGSLSEALLAAKAERKEAEEAPVVTRKKSQLTVAQSWSPGLPDDALVINRRDILRSQLAEGGLRVKRIGRGKRVPVQERVSVKWID